MPVARHDQTTFSAGEFDPALWARGDVTFFYNAARRLENVTLLPHGGVRRRDGMAFKAVQRGPLSSVSLSGATITATNGGTVANATDGDTDTKLTTTTGISTTTDYEVVRVQMASVTRTSIIDFKGLHFIDLPAGTDSATVELQISHNGSTWGSFGTLEVGETAYNRRFAAAPDSDIGFYTGGSQTSFFRLVVPNGGDLSTATIEFSEIEFYVEAGYSNSGTLGNVQEFRLTASADDEYFMFLTAGNVDIFDSAGAWVAAAYAPHTNAQVPGAKGTAYLDTLLLFEQDQPVWQIQRLESDEDWRWNEMTFLSVPEFAFQTGTVSGGENEWQLMIPDSLASGDKMVIEYNGDISSEVTWTTNEATNASALETAIESLDGITSVSVSVHDGTGANAQLLVAFDGTDEKKAWPILIFNITKGSGTIQIERLQYGRPDHDDLWSATRGYPRCGAFYQGRFWMAGFKARPDVIAASRAGSYFDFREDQEPVAGSPMVLTPSVDEQIVVHAIFPGRSLQFFTSSAEIFIPEEPITIDNVALKVATRHGTSGDATPVMVQGGTLFADRNGQHLREFLFTDAQQSYTAEPITTLARHLFSSPSSMAMRWAQSVEEPNTLLIANTGTDDTGADIPAASVVIDRAQQITGFSRIVTTGKPVAFSTTQAGDAMAVATRTVGGVEWNFYEILDPDYMSDCSFKLTHSNYDDFTATAAQTEFTYTFASPADDADVAVWTRAAATDDWSRVSDADYTVDLVAKTVTFSTGLADGTLVHLNLRRQYLSGDGTTPLFSGETVAVHGDGIYLGDYTYSGSGTDLGDERWDFEVEIGFKQLPKIVLHGFKGKFEYSPTMQRQRIYRVHMEFIRTGNVAICMNGDTAKAVPLVSFDDGQVTDPVLDEVLFTGAKRVSGIGRWQTEPVLEITQTEPMPFHLRLVSYDIRY